MNPVVIGLAGYAGAALAYAVLGLLLALRRRGDPIGSLLLAAVVGQTLWGAVMAAAAAGLPVMRSLVPLAEALRSLLWILLLIRIATLALTPGAGDQATIGRAARQALAIALLLSGASAGIELIGGSPAMLFASRTLVAIFGLVCIEQVYRNTSENRRWAIKFFAVALLALFSFDLILYSESMLFGRINPAWWVARGYANILLAPLLAIAAARNPHWQIDIGVSRQAVFHSTALTIAGGYLVLVAAGGYWLRWFGGEWGQIAQALLIFAALLALAVVLMSGRARARLRVFVAKHFFSYRFDYRQEWMRLTELLARDDSDDGNGDDGNDPAVRAVTGLGQTVDSHAGALWLESDGEYRYEGGIGWRGDRGTVPADAPMIRLLAGRDWIIDLDEARTTSARTDHTPEAGLELPPAIAAHENGWLVVPLMMDRELLGFIVLDRPLAPQAFDWETRDLLKAAARQIASHLGLQRTLEKLIRAQQFESFNRMSAFVVHDLKNLVAQLGLMTRNAQRHRGNPEFQADMLATVENVMERMQGLLLQLRVGARPVDAPAPVDLGAAVSAAIAARPALRPLPQLIVAPSDHSPPTNVLAHPDRLERVIGHLLQNAAEACDPEQGRVEVSIGKESATAVIEVRDNGRGMSEAFIQEKLFQPFASTKSHGMGIGAFESREYLREIGGTLAVESTEGVGTIFRIRLPRVESSRQTPE